MENYKAVKMNVYDYKYIGITEITGNMEEDVYRFLIENNKQETFEHVAAVAKRNNEIAEKYGLDRSICTISGYLHDISAVIHPEDMLRFMLENNLLIDDAERKYPFLLHQRISKLLAKDFFNIDDETILSAVECHSTLKPNPTQYDMALFIADKLSWDQEGTPPFYEIVSQNLSLSLEKACLSYMNYITDNHIILHPHAWFLAGKEYLEKVLNTAPKE